MPLLTAHFLGSFRVTIDGVLVDTASSKRTRGVLAYMLANRRRPVLRDVLMEVFWPAAEPAAARNRLHVALTGVRQALRTACAHPVIERRFDTYRIAETISVWTDVEQFEQSCAAGLRAERDSDHAGAMTCYEAACQLYQGDFLAEDPYLAWATAIRESLRIQAVEIQSRLLSSYIEQSQYGPAIWLGRQILTVDACNEPVHRLLMTSFAAAGQRHLALAQYHRLAATLWEEFRVRPSAESTALYEGLRRSAGMRTPLDRSA